MASCKPFTVPILLPPPAYFHHTHALIHDPLRCSPKKQRFAGFVGVFKVESVKDLLLGVMTGRVKTKPVYQNPTVGDVDCTAIKEAAAAGLDEEVFEDEEDMGDLMAEILAEERRAKEELEAEVAREAEEAKARAEEEAKEKEKEGGRKGEGRPFFLPHCHFAHPVRVTLFISATAPSNLTYPSRPPSPSRLSS